MTRLDEKHCIPCEGGMPSLDESAAARLLGQVHGWRRVEADGAPAITKQLRFKDFAAAMAFLNQLAGVAEAEQHHPDFCLRSYNLVDVTLSTHAVRGLSENDFILAAKINALESLAPPGVA